MAPVRLDPISGVYIDSRVTRGFPMGGMGSGGFSFNTDGSFGEFRLNNNWMCPVRDVRGTFHALFVRRGTRRETVLLRRTPPFREYDGVRNVASTYFAGTLPSFVLRYHDDLPVRLTLTGFTPHIPHDVRDSTLPAALFRFHLENAADESVEAAVLFSFENILGRGGTGHLGFALDAQGAMAGVRSQIVYDSITGNYQEDTTVAGRCGIRFRTEQRHHPRSHRSSVTGEYLLLVESGAWLSGNARHDPDSSAEDWDAVEDMVVTVCDGWNAAAERATVLDDFSRDGRIHSREKGRRGMDGAYHPAAAVAAACMLPAGGAREIVFTFTWWTADHVTEAALQRESPGPHDGVRVGHAYETHFAGPDAVAAHVANERPRLEAASTELASLLRDSTLPSWLVRAIQNSIDSTLCNTVIPATERLYTLEGVDWDWPMGGLTGTNDQRLAAHPYTSTFFTELDVSELDEFSRLADARGAIPHGNGNCDLGLGTTEVPYGWPLFIKDLLPATEWTDLTMSLVIQVGRLYRVTGRRDLLDRFWPVLVRGMEYLHGLAPRGVPEGGTTYDIWNFPGTFSYSATLYLATLRVMLDLAEAAEPARAATYTRRYEICATRMHAQLWDDRGYFRASETTDTIFTAALAGDWAARYLGLEPIADPDQARSHLRNQHRVLVSAALRAADGRYRALPRAEATYDGTPVRHPLAAGLPEDQDMIYVWQVLSYQAMEQIYLGLVEEGLETIRCVYDRIWHDGNAWSAGLRGDGESVYMTHPVIWAVLNALTGAALDAPRATLHLAPQVGGQLETLRCPFFFPSLWAMLEHTPASGTTTVEVLRTFGDPITVERVLHRTPAGDVHIHPLSPTPLAVGTRLTVDLPRRGTPSG